MKVNNKTVKTRALALTKDPKEVVLARISTKQAIIVAVIGLLGAVAVTLIPNLDKIISTRNEVGDERGYYEGRASMVDGAFRKTEAEIRSQSELALQLGKPETASHLKDLADEVGRDHGRFQELHSRHIEAIQDGKRLSASKIKTEANEIISRLDFKLYDFHESSKVDSDLSVKFVSSGHYSAERGFELTIPLYGKHLINAEQQVCQIGNTDDVMLLMDSGNFSSTITELPILPSNSFVNEPGASTPSPGTALSLKAQNAATER